MVDCRNCAYCSMEPDEDFTCNHPQMPQPWGLYTKHARATTGLCGPDAKLFEIRDANR